MRKKNRKKSDLTTEQGFDPLASRADFYTTSPTEESLYNPGGNKPHHALKTKRHQRVGARKEPKIDPRELNVLITILRLVIIIILLMMAYFLLKKGVSIYQESIFIDTVAADEPSPVLQKMTFDEIDLRNEASRKQFAQRIEIWQEVERLVRSADGFLTRNIYDQAIEKCQNALRLDPAHRGALERLGGLYYANGDYVESVNAYIRLLSVDPADTDVQKQLVKSLVAFGDHDAAKYMAEWYLEKNQYDSEIQRHLANAFYANEEYSNAAEAYDRVLSDTPNDMNMMGRQADAYIQTEQFTLALDVLGRLRELDHRNQTYYRQIAICNARLGQGPDTIKVLGRAAQLFGQNTVMAWVQDPQFDPVRQDRSFQVFTERLGGEEFRKWLEKVASAIEGDQQKKKDAAHVLEPPDPIEAETVK